MNIIEVGSYKNKKEFGEQIDKLKLTKEVKIELGKVIRDLRHCKRHSNKLRYLSILIQTGFESLEQCEFIYNRIED